MTAESVGPIETVRRVIGYMRPSIEDLNAADNAIEQLRADQAELVKLRAERDAIGAELAATNAALAELAHWPDLPRVQYGVEIQKDGTQSTLAVRGEQVIGVMQAIYQHIKTLAPFGESAVQALYRNERLQYERDTLASFARSVLDLLDKKYAEAEANGLPFRVEGLTDEYGDDTELTNHARRTLARMEAK